MSFHPQMDYAPARFHRSERKLADEGEAFAYTRETRADADTAEVLTMDEAGAVRASPLSISGSVGRNTHLP